MTTRAYFLGTLFCTALLAACAASTTVDDQSAGMPVPGSDAEEKEVMMEDDTEASDGAMMEGDVQVEVDADAMMQQSRVIAVSADNWTFSPSAISAKKGEQVKIRLTGIAGAHGFAVPDLGINTAIAAGQVVDVEIPTDTTGTFSFRCSVPCGSGHKEMTGTLTITE